MQTWAIANQKGGVGKTTTTLCLGRALAESGARVLLVDLDPHASLSHAFGVPIEPAPAGSHDLFAPEPQPIAAVARDTAIDGLQIVAAQPALATLERRGASQPGLGLALDPNTAAPEAIRAAAAGLLALPAEARLLLEQLSDSLAARPGPVRARDAMSRGVPAPPPR